MLDSHCHPDNAAFAGAGADLLATAAAAGTPVLVQSSPDSPIGVAVIV